MALLAAYRRTDLFDGVHDVSVHLGVRFGKIDTPQWLLPRFNTEVQRLQRAAYFSIPVAGFFGSLQAGRFINRCNSIGWSALFGGY